TFLNRALILSPDHIEAAYNAGVILTETGNLGDAETVFRRALNAPVARATTAVRISAHLRLLQLLSMQGRHNEWMREGQKFASAYPDQDRSRLIESRIAHDRGELEREAEILLPLAEQATVLADDVSALELIGALLAILSYYDVPAQLLQRLHHRFRRAARVVYPPLDALPSADANRQLQVGYLVDFLQPFVADFIGMLVGHHDLQRVSVRIYAVSPVEPAIHDALRAAGIELISVATFDEHRAAQIIRADDLDILVDVAGFGHYAKPGLLSRRPARVQLALPGFTSPVGIGDLDYRLSDLVAERDISETTANPVPIFLDGGVFPLLPVAQDRSQLTREQLGIGAEVAVFGVLAAAARLSSRCITTWKALADTLPDAVFFVCPLQVADREPIRKLLLAGGIDVARILMLPASYMRARDVTLTGLVDVILDTMPGSDYFSTRAAIHDAIPLVSISGRMFEERVALSLLSHLGDHSTIAASGRDYVDIAVKLVQELSASPIARTARTDRQRDLLRQSPIADLRCYVTQFEDVLFRAAALGSVPDRAEMSS
ncbi:MAG: hypothetical protein LH481_02630, partial [Burkholderiales bacterium]|nr:hypothetical protein [Burkholderiales bacterium]